jgi:hypothetical protein
MPVSLAGTTRNPWSHVGHPMFSSGVSRGTTTSSGVFSVDAGAGVESGGPQREVFFALAYDEAVGARTAANIAIGTKGTFYDFQPITPNGRTARWRVRRNQVSAGGTQSTMVLATSVSGVTARWFAVGI